MVVVTFLLIQFCSLYFSSKVHATIIFSISDPVVNSNDEIEVSATISGLISSSCSVNGCYFQAELQSAGGYFGYTQNNSGEYVDYFRTPASIDEIKTKLYNFVPVAGSWTGKLRAKNNPSSENYYGPGDYLLSFRRFSGNSISPTSADSNSVPVNLSLELISQIPQSTPEVTPVPTQSTVSFTLKTAPSSPIVSPSSTKTPTPKPTPTKTPKPTIFKTTNASESASTASAVLGLKVDSPADLTTPIPEAVKDKAPILPVVLILGGLCFIAIPIFSIIKNGKKDLETS